MALQVLERTAQTENPYKGVSDAYARGIELAAQMRQAKATADYQMKSLELQKQATDNETEKLKLEQEKQRWAKLGMVAGYAQRFKKGDKFDLEGFQKFGTTAFINDPDLINLFADKKNLEVLGLMQPEPEEAKDKALGDIYSNIATQMGNQTRAGAVAGEPSSDWQMTELPGTGMKNLKAMQAIKQMEAAAEQASKPYSDVDATFLARQKVVMPQLDELIKTVEAPGNVFGIRPLGLNLTRGASRIGAFAEQPKEGILNTLAATLQGLAKASTVGKGREAGVLLGNISQAAFDLGGGKALTGTEFPILMRLLDPKYKTEEKWLKDLKAARDMLIEKARLISTPRGASGAMAPSQGNGGTLSTGMTYTVE